MSRTFASGIRETPGRAVSAIWLAETWMPGASATRTSVESLRSARVGSAWSLESTFARCTRVVPPVPLATRAVTRSVSTRAGSSVPRVQRPVAGE